LNFGVIDESIYVHFMFISCSFSYKTNNREFVSEDGKSYIPCFIILYCLNLNDLKKDKINDKVCKVF